MTGYTPFSSISPAKKQTIFKIENYIYSYHDSFVHEWLPDLKFWSEK